MIIIMTCRREHGTRLCQKRAKEAMELGVGLQHWASIYGKVAVWLRISASQ